MDPNTNPQPPFAQVPQSYPTQQMPVGAVPLVSNMMFPLQNTVNINQITPQMPLIHTNEARDRAMMATAFKSAQMYMAYPEMFQPLGAPSPQYLPPLTNTQPMLPGP